MSLLNLFKKKSVAKVIAKEEKEEIKFDIFEDGVIKYIAPDNQIEIVRNYLEGNAEILESLSELNHNQWVQWVDYMLSNLIAKNITKWKLMMKVPYSRLDERDKESDREWAKKSIKIICGEKE
jgi:uncharacterized Fe-S center protein